MNLFTETASDELLAASFNENGRAYVGDRSPEGMLAVLRLVNTDLADLAVVDGFLTDVVRPETVAPSTPCELTYTQVLSHPKRLCESCMQPAFLHRSFGDPE